MRSGHAPTLTATIPAVALLATPRPHRSSYRPLPTRSRSGGSSAVWAPGRRSGCHRRWTRRGQEGRRENAVRLRVPLPARDVRLTIRAVDGRGRGASTTIGPVFSLPATAEPRAARRSVEDPRLARTIRSLARAFPGSAASTCRTCAPARAPPGTPARGSRPRRPSRSRLRSRCFGARPEAAARPGSTCCSARRSSRPTTGRPTTCSRGSAARRAAVPRMEPALPRARHGRHGHVRRLHRHAGPDPDPDRRSAELRRQAHDGGRPRDAHALAEPRRGRAGRAIGGFRPSQARFLLYLLAHSQVSRIDRFLPPGPTVVLQKAGWISTAPRPGLVYWQAEASSPVS